jgi:hypothetical protein
MRAAPGIDLRVARYDELYTVAKAPAERPLAPVAAELPPRPG